MAKRKEQVGKTSSTSGRRRQTRARVPDPCPNCTTPPNGVMTTFGQRRNAARAKRMKGVRKPINYRKFWLYLLKGQFEEAEQEMLQLLSTYRPQQLYLRLIVPTLAMSGTMFVTGRITYRDEHRVTWSCLKLMRILRGHIVAAPRIGLRALATGVGQDSHRIGLRLVCDLMHASGWDVRFLDTNERGTVRNALHEYRPHALLLSIGYVAEFEQARRLVDEARRSGFTGVIAIGGRAVAANPDALERIGADMTASNGLDLARKLTVVCWEQNGMVLELAAVAGH